LSDHSFAFWRTQYIFRLHPHPLQLGKAIVFVPHGRDTFKRILNSFRIFSFIASSLSGGPCKVFERTFLQIALFILIGVYRSRATWRKPGYLRLGVLRPILRFRITGRPWRLSGI
jgi:hypothetical protein